MELLQFIFDIPGVEVFLTEKLCQDSLVGFFSMQRQRGRTHEKNLNVQEFLNNSQQITVIRSICQGSMKENCRASTHEKTSGHAKGYAPLPRRKCPRK